MGGEQAASTLWTVRQQAGKQEADEAEAAEAFKAPIRERFEREGAALYSTARLWDDGVIDPAESRAALGLALAATANSPASETRFGVFRV
jgi:3-methylcrotonyl-CoA carboxylase beta subunit